MLATAARWAAKKGKPKMAPIELTAPPEQAQSITRAIFDVVREHGPLTISDVWDHVKVTPGSWAEGLDKQEADEDHAAMDEGEAEAQAHLRPRWASQAVSLHHLVHQSQERAAEAGQEGPQRGASQTMSTSQAYPATVTAHATGKSTAGKCFNAPRKSELVKSAIHYQTS